MNSRQKKTTLSAGLALAIALSAGVATVFAVHNDNLFELGPGIAGDEGGLTNILGDGVAGNGPDWADIFDQNGNVVNLFGGNGAVFVKDDVSAGSATDRTVYSGGPGDKNKDVIADWTWTTSSVPAKDDITNAYAYVTTNPTDGHLILYAGVEREDPSGSSHIDLEFFQNQIGLSEAPPCDAGQCTFTGTNKDGDLLINMDFSQGGSFAGLSIRKRHEGVTNNYDLIENLGTQGCDANDTACAFANGGSIDGGPWPNFDNHGAVITNLLTNSFTEFGIDITALLGTTPCFATVEVKTRSSGSFTSTLKDFALSSFQQCTSTAATEIHSGPSVGATHTAPDIQNTTVAVGTTVHDKAIVTGTKGFPTPTGTVTFKRFTTIDCSGTSTDQVDVPLTEVAAPTPTTAGVSAAESSSFTPPAGFLSYQAVYNGDTNYPTPVTSPCEPLTVVRTNSAVNTDIRQDNINGSSVLNQKITTGTTVVDVATITGAGAPGTPDPTGTLTFERFANANCSGTAASSETKALTADANPNDGSVTAVSSPFTTTAAAGEFVSYKVTYSGDGVYNGSSATVCEPICSFTASPSLP